MSKNLWNRTNKIRTCSSCWRRPQVIRGLATEKRWDLHRTWQSFQIQIRLLEKCQGFDHKNWEVFNICTSKDPLWFTISHEMKNRNRWRATTTGSFEEAVAVLGFTTLIVRPIERTIRILFDKLWWSETYNLRNQGELFRKLYRWGSQQLPAVNQSGGATRGVADHRTVRTWLHRTFHHYTWWVVASDTGDSPRLWEKYEGH